MSLPSMVVERGHIAMFARALGATDPVYYDLGAAREAGFRDVPAPPTFVEAMHHFDPDFAFAPRPGRPWFGSARDASSGPRPTLPTSRAGGSDVHAETHLSYGGGWLCAGERIWQRSRPGRCWERRGRRAGALTFFEEIRDMVDAAGRTRVSVRTVGVSTEHPTSGGGPAPTLEGLLPSGPGAAQFDGIPLIQNLSRAQIVQYAGASGDLAPYHTDEVWCREVGGHPTVFAHGMLTMGATACALPAPWRRGALVHLASRFTSPVWPGDDLIATVVAGAVPTPGWVSVELPPGSPLRVLTANQRGEVVLDSFAVGRSDGSI